MRLDHVYVLMRAAMLRSTTARQKLTEYSVSLLGTFVGPDEAKEVRRLEERSDRESARFSLWCGRYREAQRRASDDKRTVTVA